MSMNPAFFLKNLERIITGVGFKKEVQIPFLAFHDEADGAPLTAKGIATDDDVGIDHISNTIVLVWGESAGSGSVDEISFPFVVPQDYDEAEDYLRLRLKAFLDTGTTDTPGIDAHVYKNGVDSNLDPTISADLSTTAAWVEIVISDKTESLVAGDVLTISLFPEAHDSGGIGVYGITMEYKSDLVYYNDGNR